MLMQQYPWVTGILNYIIDLNEGTANCPESSAVAPRVLGGELVYARHTPGLSPPPGGAAKHKQNVQKSTWSEELAVPQKYMSMITYSHCTPS